MAKKVVYIHGSYDLESEASRDAFNKRKAELNEQGFIVYTPFELCLGAEGDTFKCNRLIVRKLTECDFVYYIDWRDDWFVSVVSQMGIGRI